ncbi:alpha/beta fold hydrolase [Mycobacterium sp. OAE908]|uniref:alpha/beta fold hydrolase n=1 Tax=Mycobacterium sp. OAE908 TaxID=2817899 RepID=UPI001AE9BB2F
MITPSPNFESTDLGRLHVRRTGTGPPVVLFHSLFVDSNSWGPLVYALASDRTVYTIDAPSHGKSEAVDRDFAFDELVAAAQQALDRLGLTEPVDWVGNALGGHIGIHLAAAEHSRLRTLTTIGTPVQAFTLGEKITKGWPLVQMYRFTGPIGLLVKLLSDSLLGTEALAAQPDRAATVMAAFSEADRRGMLHAMRSTMLRRSGVEELLPHISIPTLVMSARDDVMGWRPDEARHTCAKIPDCRVEAVAGGGHVAPLLLEPDRIARLLTDFWRAAKPTPCTP